MFFCYFIIISSWKRAGLFVNAFSLFYYYLFLEKGRAHLQKLKSTSLKDSLCQVWLKLAQGVWRRRFLDFVNIFSLFCYYLPLAKGVVILFFKKT